MKPRCLDLFCGAGGAGMGLHQAGFEVVGVDINPQPRYPFTFIQADALTFDLGGFDFIWASPPCQSYSSTKTMHTKVYPDLIAVVRRRLVESGREWCIENVGGSPLGRGSIRLCGLMFGLKVLRHRWFETSRLLFAPHHPRHPKNLGLYSPRKCGSGSMKMGEGRDGFVCVVGKDFPVPAARRAMDIDWMVGHELAEAIPPAYSRYIGEQMMPHVLRAMQAKEVA